MIDTVKIHYYDYDNNLPISLMERKGDYTSYRQKLVNCQDFFENNQDISVFNQEVSVPYRQKLVNCQDFIENNQDISVFNQEVSVPYRQKLVNCQDFSENYQYQNFRIRKNGIRITIEGSICKFVKGNNYENISVHEATQGITKLINILGIPNDGKIYRMDAAVNIELENPVREYLNSFKDLTDYKRLVIPENGNIDYYQGKYKKRVRVFTLYDKIKELIDNKKKNEKLILPSSKNLLRIEYRTLRNFKSKLKLKSNEISNLDAIIEASVKQFEDNYFMILKEPQLKPLASQSNTTPRDIIDYIVLQAIKGRTIAEVIKPFEDNIDRTTKSRVKRKLKELIEDKRLVEDNSLIEEINNKFSKTLNQLKGQTKC